MAYELKATLHGARNLRELLEKRLRKRKMEENDWKIAGISNLQRQALIQFNIHSKGNFFAWKFNFLFKKELTFY